MFTGIVQDIGEIKKISKNGNYFEIDLKTKLALNAKIDDSIAVNGVCLTITHCQDQVLTVAAIKTTLLKTNLKNLKVNQKINLELALTLQTPLGGHLVSGHVSHITKVSKVTKTNSYWLMEFMLLKELKPYCFAEGSITINGVSLTISRITARTFEVSIIPHSLKMTTLDKIKIGEMVNIEVDMIGKYIENLLMNHPIIKKLHIT